MAMAVESSSRSSASADSYIGSLISLTSKSEMRYEGVLYNINTDESSIGLRNVRSFGTEGRKKDGPQVPPSEKVYEYILFRGSDIKDLQVKSSPPAQAPPPINNDPAIIQSHYPRPPSTSATFPSPVSGPPTDLSSQNAQFGPPGSNFQSGMPLYQPGANMGGPWGPPPPPQNAPAGGLPMPMYLQGYYNNNYNFPQNGLPQLSQQSLLRPPPGLPMPPLQQPIQYPGFNPSLPIGTSNFPGLNLPENPSLVPSTTGSLNFPPTSSPSLAPQSNLPPAPSLAVASENFQNLISNKPSVNAPSSLPPAPENFQSLISNKPSDNFQSLISKNPSMVPILSTPPLTANLPAVSSTISNKTNVTSVSTLSYPIMSQPMSSIGGGSNIISPTESLKTPSLVTPGQLMPAAVSVPQQTAHKDVEVVEVAVSSKEPSAPVAVEAQPPLLPLPQSSRTAVHKPNGAPYRGRPAYRGRERGRGPGFSRPVTKFAEDFDFTAMNEKFNKDEVWGHLGKSNKSHKEGEEGSDEDDYEDDEDYSEAAKVEVKPVYNKDDFFDSISSNALDRESNAGRIRFSEQRKIDTETFGDFSRYQGGRGGHWNGRGGGRYRGSYRGRGYGGGGGYSVRGGGGGYSVRGGGGGRGPSNRDF